MSTLDIVEQILKERRTALAVREIVDLAGDRLPTKSRTPATVVARDLAMDIKRRGEESRFARVGPGRYSLREHAAVAATEPASEAPSPEVLAVEAEVLAAPLEAPSASTSDGSPVLPDENK